MSAGPPRSCCCRYFRALWRFQPNAVVYNDQRSSLASRAASDAGTWLSGDSSSPDRSAEGASTALTETLWNSVRGVVGRWYCCRCCLSVTWRWVAACVVSTDTLVSHLSISLQAKTEVSENEQMVNELLSTLGLPSDLVPECSFVGPQLRRERCPISQSLPHTQLLVVNISILAVQGFPVHVLLSKPHLPP